MFMTTCSILLLFVSAYFVRKSTSPPQPPAPVNQRVGGQRFVRVMRITALTSGVSFCFLCLGEVMACLSSTGWFSKSGIPSLALRPMGGLGSCLTKDKPSSLYPNARLPIQAAIGLILAIVGGLIRAASQKALGHHFTWEVSIRRDHQLVTSGPYAYIRHPGYTGAIMTMTGQNMMALSSGTFLHECLVPAYPVFFRTIAWVCSSIYIGVVAMMFYRTGQEDGLMKKEFGRTWDDWASRTRYKLIPGVI